MSSSPQKTLKIVCSHCQVEFAIAPKADLAGNLEIPCPSCWMVVAVPADAQLQDADTFGPDQQWQSGRAVVHAKRSWSPSNSDDADRTMEIEVNPKTTLPVGLSASTYPVTVSVDVTILSPGSSADNSPMSEARPGLESFLGEDSDPTEDNRMPFFRNTLDLPATHRGDPGRLALPAVVAPVEGFKAPPPRAAVMPTAASKNKLQAVLKKIQTGLADSSSHVAAVVERPAPRAAKPLPEPSPTRPAAAAAQPSARAVSQAPAAKPYAKPSPPEQVLSDEGDSSGTMRLHAISREPAPIEAPPVSEDRRIDLRSRLKKLGTGKHKVLKRFTEEEADALRGGARSVEVKPSDGRKAGLISDAYPARGAQTSTAAQTVSDRLSQSANPDDRVPRSTGMLHRVEPEDIAAAEAERDGPHSDLRAMLAQVKRKSQAAGTVAGGPRAVHQPTLIGMRAPEAAAIAEAKAAAQPQLSRRQEHSGITEISNSWPTPDAAAFEVPSSVDHEPDVTERDLAVGVDIDIELGKPVDELALVNLDVRTERVADGRTPSTPDGRAPDSSGDWQEIPLSESGLWDTGQLKGAAVDFSEEGPQPVTMELPQITIGESVVEQAGAQGDKRDREPFEDSVQVRLSALKKDVEGPDTDVVVHGKSTGRTSKPAMALGTPADSDKDLVAVISRDDVGPAPPKSPWVRKVAGLLWAAAVLALLGAVGIGLQYTEHGAFAHKAWLLPLAGGHLATVGDATNAKFRKHVASMGGHGAITAASAAVADAIGPSPIEADGVIRLARYLVEEGKPNQARKLLERAIGRGVVSSEIATESVDLLLAENRPRHARELAWKAIDLRGVEQALVLALNKSIAADQKYSPETIELLSGRDFKTLRRGPASDPISFLLTTNAGDTAFFMPAIKEHLGPDTAPIVAWRLCQYMRCPLEIPYAQDARISLEAISESAAWSKDLLAVDLDGKPHTIGAFGNVESGGASLPIEYVDVWRPWLALDVSPGVLELPARDNLGAMGGRTQQRDLDRQLADRKVEWLAQQISSLIVLDFLMSNNDRFAVEERHFGETVRVTPTGLRVTDFFGAFSSEGDAARRRLEDVERFSSQQTTSLRALDKESAGRWFFTRNGEVDVGKLEQFWERRAAYLSRIDELRNKSREEKVLSLP